MGVDGGLIRDFVSISSVVRAGQLRTGKSMKTDVSSRSISSLAPIWCAVALLLASCAAEQSAQQVRPLNNLDRSLYDAAESFEKRRDYVAAVSYYRNLYRRNADDVGAVVGLSRGLRHLQQAREAQAIILRAMKNAPKDMALRAELGKVQLALGKPLKAVDTLSRVDAELKTKQWDIKVALAMAHDRVGLYEQAERRYQQALEISPENAVVMNNFALSLAQAGQLVRAIEILERAAALPEATPRMRQNLALLYAMNGDLTLAEQFVRRDMPANIADHNMAYYRQLRTGMSNDASPDLPLLARKREVRPSEAPPPEVRPREVLPPPAKIVATEDTPAKTSLKTAKAVAMPPPQRTKTVAKTAAKTAVNTAVEAKVKPDGKQALIPEETVEIERAPAKTDVKEGAAVQTVAEPAPKQVEKPATIAKAKPKAATQRATKAADNPVEAEAKVAALPSKAAEPMVTAKPAVAKNNRVKEPARDAMPKAQSTPGKTAKPAVATGQKPDQKTDQQPDQKAAVKPEPNPVIAAVAGFRLQLGSFRSMAGAEAMRERILKAHGDLLHDVELVVETVNVPDRGNFFRVNSHTVPRRDMIDETCLKLAIRDVPCLLARAP
jgi:Flp pilus assembly protein TadD